MTESGLKRLVALVSAASLAAAIWIVARTFIFPPPLTPPQAQEAPAAPAAPPQAKPTTSNELTRTILGNDVFGLKPLPGSQAKPKEPPKPAEIDMELAGTVVSSTGQYSIAFLRDKANKSQKPYAVGSSVKDARIKSIGKNFIILERNGREEILTMKP